MMAPDSQVDVLIIGAGPAGLTLANWLCDAGIKVRLVDRREAGVSSGHADGLKSISIEMLDSLGLGDLIRPQFYPLEELTFWGPDKDGNIARLRTMQNSIPGFGKCIEVIVPQGQVHNVLMTRLASVPIERSKEPVDLEFDSAALSDQNAFPVTVKLQSVAAARANGTVEVPNGYSNHIDIAESRETHANGHHLPTEIVKAKYVVGCDGARSWVRDHLGIKSKGEDRDSLWGVLDIIPKTDFPDTRRCGVIEYGDDRLVLYIPRKGAITRFYVHIGTVPAGSAIQNPKSFTSEEKILARIQTIMAPFKIEYDYCEWWSVYRIGERVADRYAENNRVFLCGDAAHTHSPNSGQGMNTAIQDSYNLGWKLRACLQNWAPASLLESYEEERRPVGVELVNFENKFSQLFTNDRHGFGADVIDISTMFQDEFHEGSINSCGLQIKYDAAPLTVARKLPKGIRNPAPAVTGIIVGKRLFDVQIVNQCEALTTQIHKVLTANGSFRILIFPGDISKEPERTRYTTLGRALSSLSWCRPRSYVAGRPAITVAEVFTIHCAKRLDVEMLDFPEIFHPWSDSKGWDYWKMFADDDTLFEGHGQAYEKLGIHKDIGCVLVIRPDGYVGMACDMLEVDALETYFSSVTTITTK